MILCTTHPTPLRQKLLRKEIFVEFIFADKRVKIYQFYIFLIGQFQFSSQWFFCWTILIHFTEFNFAILLKNRKIRFHKNFYPENFSHRNFLPGIICTCWLTCQLAYLSTGSLVNWLTGLLDYWFTGLLICWLTGLLANNSPASNCKGVK